MSRRNHKQFSFKPSQAKRRHVMVVVFTEDERRGWVNPFLTATLMRLALDPRIWIDYVPIHAIYPVDAARNRAVHDYFLKSDAEILVLFDNDVSPPANIADAILSMPEACDIAVMPYWVWLPEGHTMPCFGKWEDGIMIVPDPSTIKPGWQEMGAGGTGCMFVKRRVFTSDKLEQPFFRIISDAYKGQVKSEDIYFTGRAADAGFKVYINADFVCSHFRTIDLADVNLGIVRILNRFFAAIKEKYGDVGTSMRSMIEELHPELQPAAEILRAEIERAEK